MSSKRHLLGVHQRETLIESMYVEELHTTVRLLKALKEDESVLLDYIGDVERIQEPLSVASDISIQNQWEFYKQQTQKWLQQPFTIMVTDCFEVFGLSAGQLIKNSKVHKSLDLDSDYTEKIAKSEAPSEEGKFMQVFLEEMHSRVPNFLPETCQEYFQIEMFDVHQEYQEVEVALFREALKLVRNAGVKFVVMAVTSNSMFKLTEKFHFKSKFIIPYINFTSNGEPVFGEAMHDGVTSEAHLMIGDLNEIEEELADRLPSLPEAYRLPRTQRRLLDEVFVERLGGSIKYEVACPEDEPVIRDFLVNEHYRQTNVPKTLQCRKEDSRELMTRFHPETIQEGLVILGIFDGKLCAISVNRNIQIPQQADRTPQSILIPEDFTSLIDAQPLKHIGGKTLRAINTWMESKVPGLLSRDCDRYLMLNMLAVHPDFRGCRIAYKLWSEALNIGREKGYRYVQCMCSAIGSCKVAEKIGLKMAVCLPYSKITYKGKKLFENDCVSDGGKLFNMYLGDLNN